MPRPPRVQPCDYCGERPGRHTGIRVAYRGEAPNREEIPPHRARACRECFVEQYEERHGVHPDYNPFDDEPVPA